MDALLASSNIEHTKLDITNWCRYHCNAMFVSNITSTDGYYFAEDSNSPAPPSILPYIKEHTWPIQGIPNATSWQ
eukprot:10716422-Ditylum_brightwellii.AAC.2